jgi:hypothetical protein
MKGRQSPIRLATKRLKGDRGLQARHIAPSADQLAVARDEKLGYIEDNT